MSWLPLCDLSELPVGSRRLLRAGSRRVAVFHLEDGRLLAVDDACPHEGYPLVRGQRDGCVLTCIWHNYKFDLASGRCLMGEEDVATFPTRVRQGVIEVEVSERPPDLVGLRRSLEEGLLEGQLGRVARELVRLGKAGVSAEALALQLASFDAARGKWGPGHTLPVVEDVRRAPGVDVELGLLHAAEVAYRACGRRPLRERPEPVAGALADIPAAVEAEDAGLAEGLLRHAIAQGARREALEPLFIGLCAQHFLDFGHQAIYVARAFDLLEAAEAGPSEWDTLLGGLLYGVVVGTREDALPEWAGWRKRMRGLDLGALWAAPLKGGPAWWDRSQALEALLTGAPGAAFERVAGLLAQGVPRADVMDLLSAAACQRMLRFDHTLEARPDLQHGWLDVTHRWTFVVAVRALLERWEDPRVLVLIFQAVHFLSRSRALDAPHPTPFGEALDWPELRAAAFDGRTADPIQSAHRIKTWLAALEESRRLEGDLEWADWPRRALARFLAAPRAESRVRQRLHEARELVNEGRVPRTLC